MGLQNSEEGIILMNVFYFRKISFDGMKESYE